MVRLLTLVQGCVRDCCTYCASKLYFFWPRAMGPCYDTVTQTIIRSACPARLTEGFICLCWVGVLPSAYQEHLGRQANRSALSATARCCKM